MADSADAIFDKAEESLKTVYYGLNVPKQSEGQTKVLGLQTLSPSHGPSPTF